MGTNQTTGNAILNLALQATTWANYAINATTSPEVSIYFCAHTADPGASGTQTSSEANYTGYTVGTRPTVNRSGTTPNWGTAAAGVSQLSAAVNFPASTAASPTNTLSFFSIGKSGGGAGPILWSGTISPNITVNASGITPQLTTASSITLT